MTNATEFQTIVHYALDLDTMTTPASNVTDHDTYAEALADLMAYVTEENLSMSVHVEDGEVFWKLYDGDTDTEIGTASIR
jgi:galactose-1-phosphate uridylyltransferase